MNESEMMMTTKELESKLFEIDFRLFLIKTDDGEPSSIYWGDSIRSDTLIYDFGIKGYGVQGFIIENCLKHIPDKIHGLNKLLDEYYKGRKEILARDSEDSVDSTDTESKTQGHSAKELGETVQEFGEAFKNFNLKVNKSSSEDNPFKKYTDKLAETLLEKNTAYGDSFSRSVDKFGIIAAVVRLEDKFNRLENLTANGGKEKVKDESLADTALDISGYGLLLYKYLKERERTSKQNGRNKEHENENN